MSSPLSAFVIYFEGERRDWTHSFTRDFQALSSSTSKDEESQVRFQPAFWRCGMRSLFSILAGASFRGISSMAVKPVTELSPRAFLHQPISPPPTKNALSTSIRQPSFSMVVEPNKIISNCLWHVKFHLLARRRTPIPASHVPVQECVLAHSRSRSINKRGKVRMT